MKFPISIRQKRRNEHLLTLIFLLWWFPLQLELMWSKSRWWSQFFIMFILIWGRFPFWRIFFRWVETTNQKLSKTSHLFCCRNPMAVSALCCLVGLALSVISVLSIIGVARMDDEKSWTPRDSCQMFYQFLVLTAAQRSARAVVFTAMKKRSGGPTELVGIFQYSHWKGGSQL